MLLGVADDHSASLPRQLRFQCSRNLVKAGVDHLTVPAGCFPARFVMPFQGGDGKALKGKLAGNGASNDPTAAYDAHVEHRSGKSVKMPSTANERKFEISSG